MKKPANNKKYRIFTIIFILGIFCLFPVVHATGDTADNWKTQGDSYYSQGRFQEALDAYNNALSIDPNDADAWNSKGVVLEYLGKYQEALNAFDTSASINSTYPVAFRNKGLVLNILGRYQEALDAENKALLIDPEYEEAWANKGNSLNKLGKYQEALDAFDKALSIDPNDKLAWILKGIALENLGRTDEALQAYDQAVSIDPDFSLAIEYRERLEQKGTAQAGSTITTPAIQQTPTPQITPQTTLVTNNPVDLTAGNILSSPFMFIGAIIIVAILLFITDKVLSKKEK